MTDATAQVRPHNFKRQETLERGRLRHLTPIVDSFSHRMAGTLTTMLHTAVRLEAGEIRQDSWERFATELPESTFLASSILAPSGARIVIHVPLPMAMAMVDLRLGGNGEGDAPERPLTDIESQLVNEVARQLLADVVLAIDPALPLHVSATTSVTSTMYLQVPNASDAWLLFPLTIEVGETTTFEAGLWFPSALAVSLLEALARKDASEDTAADDDTLERVRHRLLGTSVEIAVRFPGITLSTEELLSLTPGDVIPLHREQGLPMYLTIDDARHCDVVLTPRGRRLACTVVEPTTQENA